MWYCDRKQFAGVLGEKIRMRAILKENTADYILLKRSINVDLGKKNINCRFLPFRKRKSQTTTKMTLCHSIELIGYQIQEHWQNNCTVLIRKASIIKSVSAFFDIVTGYFFINLSSSSSKEYAMGIASKIATVEIL